MTDHSNIPAADTAAVWSQYFQALDRLMTARMTDTQRHKATVRLVKARDAWIEILIACENA